VSCCSWFPDDKLLSLVHQPRNALLLTNAFPGSSDLDENTKTHGTDDVDGFGEDYITAARDLLSTWVNNPEDLAEGALAPYQNAENIAAAATGKSLVDLGSLVWSEMNTDLVSSTQRTGSSSSVDSRKLLWMVRGCASR
jgi:hypothetical protein